MPDSIRAAACASNRSHRRRHGDAARASSGSATAEPELGLDLTRVARLAPISGARIGDRAVLEANFRLQTELNFLEFVQRLAVRANERQVGREIIAKFGRPFELGYDMAVALEKTRELLVDMLRQSTRRPAA